MKKYNYLENIKEDIINYIESNEIEIENYEELYDDLFIEDSVTGNASGSYTFNRYEAKANIEGNEDILLMACEEFCVDKATIGEKFLEANWEWFDITIRCYLLGQALAELEMQRL